MTLTKQEKQFLRRVALQLEGSGQEPTHENIIEAMRAVCRRDEEIVTQLLALDKRTRCQHWRYGNIPGTREESPLSTLSRSVYDRIRARERAR